MATAAKKPAKAAQKPAAKTTPTPAPRPRASIIDPAAGIPKVGIDPRTVDGSAAEGTTDIKGGGYHDERGAMHAAPPTPTRESAATANDAPGAGGDNAATARPRRTLLTPESVKMVKVKVPKAFRLTDASGAEHHYDATTKEMSQEHAEHWYAKAHGVEFDADE